MRIRSCLAASLLIANVAAGCGSDEVTSSTTPDDRTDVTVAEPGDDATNATTADGPAETAPGAPDEPPVTVTDESTEGTIDMTFTVENSTANPSLNGVATTVSGFCNVSESTNILYIEGGEESDPESTDRPDFFTFIADAPVAGKTAGLLQVVAQGLQSSSLNAQGTFDGTTLSLFQADDPATTILTLVLSEPCNAG